MKATGSCLKIGLRSGNNRIYGFYGHFILQGHPFTEKWVAIRYVMLRSYMGVVKLFTKLNFSSRPLPMMVDPLFVAATHEGRRG